MRRALAGVFLFTMTMVAAVPAAAQPFGAWLTLSGPAHGYLQVPHSSALNPTGAITIEAWITDSRPDSAGEDCRSIAGKDYQQAWWIGVCQVGGVKTLRSYLQGNASALQGGRIPQGQWTHVAVTYDGVNRRHYINGELVLTVPHAGPLGTSNSPVRIGSDVSWGFSPSGSIDEVRLWSVARTTSQIRDTINVRIDAAQPGLVAVWPLDANGNDVIAGHNAGALQGSGGGFLTGPVALDCGSQTATSLCIGNQRFNVTARYRTGPQTNPEGQAQTIPCFGALCANSGIFWFFQDINWELMVKVLDACALNNRWWVFNAGLTNVYFRLEVTDVTSGVTKVYFNYPGPPAAAITDTSAFATCP